jgi:ADP-dependent NAD(P)H-hydrate dehydratase / NAD(P)H-hydrate epimerase
MMKILNTEQMREWDAYTIQHEPVPSIDLMERASKTFVQWFTEKFDASKKVGIICGTGNNGGDGLAIARILKEWNYPVKVWIVKGDVKETVDFKANLEKLGSKIPAYEIKQSSDQGLFHDRDVLIDAIFGSGLSRPADGIYAQAIRCINRTNAVRIAVDIPSGLLADRPSSGEVVQANYTVTFQAPKLSFFFPQSQVYTGEWTCVDIGLNKPFVKETNTPYSFVTKRGAKSILKLRHKFAHKGEHGKALLIAGSYGKMGACILAARATLHSGVGLLTLHVPRSGYAIVQTAVPEAMASVDSNEQLFTECPSLESYQVIGIGPGIGRDDSTAAALRKTIASGKPLVIDADALNILSEHRDLLRAIPSGSILTPHPGEFERLVGKWNDDFERLHKQIELAKETKATIILKGAHSSIATPEGKVFFNSTGNPGMATGGSGDVLTGILTGLLAQGYTAEEASILGVYLHGLSGDLVTQERSVYSLTASDLISFLPLAFRALQS